MADWRDGAYSHAPYPCQHLVAVPLEMLVFRKPGGGAGIRGATRDSLLIGKGLGHESAFVTGGGKRGRQGGPAGGPLADRNRIPQPPVPELDAPQITDEAYDSLFRELVAIEQRYPRLQTPDSPTLRVGGAVLSSLETRPHSLRMYGLDNVFSGEEWNAFVQRAARQLPEAPAEIMNAWWADPKLDRPGRGNHI